MDNQNNLTPSEIVKKLDDYIISQDNAKKAVAIAIRNRFRRLKLPKEMQEEISPKNILMIGPTGVGKTEIAKRLSSLLKAPFIKVEATKYTEIGYVGRNVESMIRDLVSISVNMIKKEKQKEVEKKAAEIVEEKIIDKLFPFQLNLPDNPDPELINRHKRSRDKIKSKYKNGDFDEKYIEIENENPVSAQLSSVGVISNASDFEDMNMNIKEMIDEAFSKKIQKRKLQVKDAKRLLIQKEIDKLLDMEKIYEEAIILAENSGIIFIDEIDKIAGKEQTGNPNVSREGVQRDILPVIEGTTVKTRFGNINTDHILFIAAGAFHMNKPSDLIPELQGRFPIRVELNSLGKKEIEKILVAPKNSLLKQYQALLKTENVTLKFSKGTISKIAAIADSVNQGTEDIGARRLYSILEKLLEDILFNADKNKGKTIYVTPNMVEKNLADIAKDRDLSRYIL